MRARRTTTGSFGMSEGWDEETDELHTRVFLTPAEAFSTQEAEARPTLESLPKAIRTISKASGSEWESEDTELAPSLRGLAPWPSSQWSTTLDPEPALESTPRMPWTAQPEPPFETLAGAPSPLGRPPPLAQATRAPQDAPTRANLLSDFLRGRVARGLPIAFTLSIVTLGLVLVTTWGRSDVRVDRIVAAFIDPSRDPRIEPAATVDSAPGLAAVTSVSMVARESAPRALPSVAASADAPVVAAPERAPVPVTTTLAPNGEHMALENPTPKPLPARTKPSVKPSPKKGAPKQSLQKTRGASAAEDLARRQLLQSAL
jgi:hypothetical protein